MRFQAPHSPTSRHRAPQPAPQPVPFAPAMPRLPGVPASFGYLGATPERPFNYMYQPPAGTPWQNCEYALQRMHVVDARATAARPSIDREGYELWDAPSAVDDFADEAAIRRYYYAEAAELARWVTGARQAWVFDHLVRRREAGRPALGFGRQGDGSNPAAVGRVHNDYSEASGRRRLDLVLTDPVALARVERFAIVNIWRSIRGPVLDTPLAVCDARSVSSRDLVAAEIRYPERTGEIYLVRHAARHQWAYFPGMDRHEALIFKQYDSQINGTARFTPHSAFDLPDVPPDTPLRESIEVRCLVVFE